MADLKIRNLQKGFDGTAIIKGIDLDIENREFVVFVGPSGCGKSTLLRLIAGLEEVSSGTITLDGVDITDTAPAKRDLAMVFQTYALYPHMTVRKNLSFALDLARVGKGEVEEKVANAARILELGALLERKPKQLSGGQRQRVAIGRAIVRNPKIFLFDEPLSNLDAALRVQTRLELARLHKELKATMIYVTHDQVEAMTLAQRMIVMNGGVMEQFGTPEEVYHTPASTFVASFIGSPPMNLLKNAPGAKPGTILGIRPEHLDVGSEGWAVTVETVELLGAERLIYGRLNGEQIIVRVEGGTHAPQPDSVIHVLPRPDRLHAFDATTGKRIPG